MEKATKVCFSVRSLRELPDENAFGNRWSSWAAWVKETWACTQTHTLIHSSPPKLLLLMFLGLPAVTLKVHLTYKVLIRAFLWHYAKHLQYWQVENIAHIVSSMWLQHSSIKQMLKQLNHADFSVTIHTSILSWYLLYKITITVFLFYWNIKGWCYKQELFRLQEPTWFYKTLFQINVWLHGSFLPLIPFGPSFHLHCYPSAFSKEPVPHWASLGALRRVAIPTSTWLSAGKESTVDIATSQSSSSAASRAQVVVTAVELKLLSRNEGSNQAPWGVLPPAPSCHGQWSSLLKIWVLALFSLFLYPPKWWGCFPALGVLSHPNIRGHQLTRKQLLGMSFGRWI